MAYLPELVRSLTFPTSPIDTDDGIEYDFFPYLILYKSGRVERIVESNLVPAGVDLETGVASKDVLIDPDTGVSARIFVPDIAGVDHPEKKKLPVLVYMHGGGFVIQSPFSTPYHEYVNSIAARANVLVVSVDYRLAPEHPVPAAYEDSLAALRWVLSHVDGGGPEPWLAEHGDFEHIFLAGDSAGGNIAHNILVWAAGGDDGLPEGTKIEGLILIHPYFWGKDPVGAETTESWIREKIESTWGFQCGWKMGLEDPVVDPLVDKEATLKGLPCERVLVMIARNDLFGERGRAYYEGLSESGWGGDAELHETEEEGHAFYVLNRTSDKALALMDRIVEFLNRRSITEAN